MGRRSADPRARLRAYGRPVLPLWAALVVSIASGLLLDLAYPSVGIWPLAFVAVAGSLVALIGRTAWSALLVGLAFGGTFMFVHIIWITRYLGPIPWFGLAGLEALFLAAGSILIALAYRWLPRVASGTWARLVVLPALIAALWTARELFMGSWPYTGFPWARIGMSQSEGPIARVASWIGVSGLTFLMVLLVAMVIEIVRRRSAHGGVHGGADDDADDVVRQRLRIVQIVPAVGLAVLLVALPAFPTTPSGTMTVGSVQGNGPAGYFDQRARYDLYNAQFEATRPIVDAEVDLLLWPEGGIGIDPQSDQDIQRALTTLEQRIGAPLLLNAAMAEGDDVFNRSFVWEDGEITQWHDKRNPVPFGEYVPDRWFFEMLAPDLVGLIQREYTPGTNSPVVEAAGVHIGLAICFDVIYDGVIHEGIRDGAEVLMFQTNNADFRDTDENLQQLAFARMRAIETGRSVVNISTVGTSQVIAPDGTTIDHLPAGEPGAMVTAVELRTGVTPAVLISSTVETVLFWGSLVALVLAGVLARRRRRV